MSVKKKLIVYGVYGLIKVDERIWRGSKGSYQRLLPSVLGVTHRGYTHSLQRAMSDFGLDESFCKAAAKIKEHYGFELPVSSLRNHCIGNATRIARQGVEIRNHWVRDALMGENRSRSRKTMLLANLALLRSAALLLLARHYPNHNRACLHRIPFQQSKTMPSSRLMTSKQKTMAPSIQSYWPKWKSCCHMQCAPL